MPDADVAIVGGGVSGLYAAWRLSTLPDPPKIALFESSGRLGGRIDTGELPVPPPAAKAEFGAMRFLPSMQMVSSLLGHLAIEREPFPGVQVQELFLRGVPVGAEFPYNLAPGEPKDPGQILFNVLNGALPGAMTFNAQQWRDAVKNARFKNFELWRWAVQNVAEDFISNEAYDFLTDCAGLDSAFLRSNAAFGMRSLAAVVPDLANKNVYRPVAGFASLIAALEQGFTASANSSLHIHHRLVSVSRARGGLALNFTRSGTEAEDSEPEQVIADKLILAMPRRSLELIDWSGLFPGCSAKSRNEFMSRLAAVHGIPAFKLAIVYEQPWWQNFHTVSGAAKGWKNGCAVTDLPLRQVFFGLGTGSTAEGNERVLLAAYADTRAAQYWRGQAQVSANCPHDGADGRFLLTGPGNLTDAIEQQLRAILQIQGPLPPALRAGFMDWSADPFGGGWHEWGPGVDVTTAIPAMRHPIPDTPVYICGEAYSWLQCWIEGALMSAERMLQDQFEIPAAAWLPRDYDLGP